MKYVILFSCYFTTCFVHVLQGHLSISSNKLPEVKDNSVLYINLNKEIVDRAANNPFKGFDITSMQTKSAIGLNDILKAIENAKDDPKIKGILMEVDAVNAGAATTDEIRNALLDFKESGKFIISYNDLYSQKAYFLSSVADNIYMNPEGRVDWIGIRSEVMYYKNILEKLGVEPQIIRHGKFKSAVELFMLDKMSDANRQQTRMFVSSIWNHIAKGISERRKIDLAQLQSIADGLLIQNADDAIKYKFADQLVYKDEMIDILKTKLGLKPKDEVNYVTLSKYKDVNTADSKVKFTKSNSGIISRFCFYSTRRITKI